MKQGVREKREEREAERQSSAAILQPLGGGAPAQSRGNNFFLFLNNVACVNKLLN